MQFKYLGITVNDKYGDRFSLIVRNDESCCIILASNKAILSMNND